MSGFRAFQLACLLLLLPASTGWSDGALLSPLPFPYPVADDQREPAAGMFLVASRDLGDTRFKKTVIYLLMHDADGTLGLIVNRPSGLTLSEVIPDIRDKITTPHPMLYGGPVKMSLVTMLLRNEKETRIVEHIADDVYASGDRRVLERLLREKKPADELRFYIGHAGWSAGQLDREMQRGDWYLIEGDVDAIFRPSVTRLWDRLIEKLDPTGLYVRLRYTPLETGPV